MDPSCSVNPLANLARTQAQTDSRLQNLGVGNNQFGVSQNVNLAGNTIDSQFYQQNARISTSYPDVWQQLNTINREYVPQEQNAIISAQLHNMYGNAMALQNITGQSNALVDQFIQQQESNWATDFSVSNPNLSNWVNDFNGSERQRQRPSERQRQRPSERQRQRPSERQRQRPSERPQRNFAQRPYDSYGPYGQIPQLHFLPQQPYFQQPQQPQVHQNLQVHFNKENLNTVKAEVSNNNSTMNTMNESQEFVNAIFQDYGLTEIDISLNHDSAGSFENLIRSQTENLSNPTTINVINRIREKIKKATKELEQFKGESEGELGLNILLQSEKL